MEWGKLYIRLLLNAVADIVQAYARAYIRMSLLGVNNINSLTECTKALPPFLVGFLNPDQASLDSFLNGPYNPQNAQKLLDGNLLTIPN